MGVQVDWQAMITAEDEASVYFQIHTHIGKTHLLSFLMLHQSLWGRNHHSTSNIMWYWTKRKGRFLHNWAHWLQQIRNSQSTCNIAPTIWWTSAGWLESKTSSLIRMNCGLMFCHVDVWIEVIDAPYWLMDQTSSTSGASCNETAPAAFHINNQYTSAISNVARYIFQVLSIWCCSIYSCPSFA